LTYQEARAFVDETKKYGSILGLTSICNLMQRLGNVQEQLKVIHVAGTNGKGSTCTMIASVLSEAGYKVGRYSSPAVFFYEEIYQINGQTIRQEDFAEAACAVEHACKAMVEAGQPHPTSFEVETAIAFLYFAKKECDVVVLETGMGGATDATNIVKKPVCCVLTSISMDHMGFLGDSLEKIATVKAGIIKKKCPVVTVRQKDEAMAVIRAYARQLSSSLDIANPDQAENVEYDADELHFDYAGLKGICLGITGSFQLENAELAIETIRQLVDVGYQVTEAHIRDGLRKARWPGRFETICRDPYIIIDGAHNEDAARKLQETIENCFTNRPITYIIGVLADKEHEKILKILLPYARKVYTVTPDSPRALAGKKLCTEAKRFHPDVQNEDSIAFAIEHAVSGAMEHEVILVFGSLSYLSQVKEVVAHLEVKRRIDDR
jgi:dihydrofolate synthase/folylpolyglutamate synthase